MPRPAPKADHFVPPAHKYQRVAWKPQRDGGYLLMFRKEGIQLFANYVSEPPWAAEKTEQARRWQRVFGSWRFEISKAAAEVRRYRLRQDAARARGIEAPVRTGMEAYASFLDTIEPAHLCEVERYTHRTFQIYNAIRRCPGLFELLCEHGEAPDLAGGGALAYALANLPLVIDPRPTHPLRTARRLLKRKRKDIVIALGFPPETAAMAVRVLGRIPSRAVDAEIIRVVRNAFLRGDTCTRKLLAHARRINYAAAKLVENPRIVEWLTPTLLHEIGHIDDPRDADALVRLVRDTFGMLERRRRAMPEVRSASELCALHATEVEQAHRRVEGLVAGVRRGADAGCVGIDLLDAIPRGRQPRGGYDDHEWQRPVLQLPAAPVPELPGQIEYVASDEALDLEGAQMHNCVSAYGSRVAEGECFIYRVLQPERCTLAIDLDAHGRFRVMQIHTVCNGRVQRSTRQFVERWLRTHHDPISVERVRALMAQNAPAQLARYIAADDEAAYREAACPF